MKVRLAENELRLRLALSDIEELIAGSVAECVVIPGLYVVRLTTLPDGGPEITFVATGIDVTIPLSALPEIPANFERFTWDGDSGSSHVVVERDKQRRPRIRAS